MSLRARFARFALVAVAVNLALGTLATLLHVSAPSLALGIAAYPLTVLIVRLMEPAR